MRARAFTLIEVMAVVLLMGLLASATAWSLAGQARRASLDQTMGQLARIDHDLRIAATRMGRECVLVIDLDRQQIWREERGDAEEYHKRSHAFNIPSGCRVDRLMMCAQDAPGFNARLDGSVAQIDSGEMTVACSPTGCTMSYAMLVVNERTGDTTWLMIAGLTGQAARLKNENEAHNLLTTLATGRSDAD